MLAAAGLLGLLMLLLVHPARQLCAIDLLPGMGEFLELADLPSIEFRSQLVGLMLADLFGTLVSPSQPQNRFARAVCRAHMPRVSYGVADLSARRAVAVHIVAQPQIRDF